MGAFDAAVATVRRELETVRAEIPAQAAAEFSAFLDVHLTILNDATLSQRPRETIEHEQCNAEWALKVQTEALLQQFDQIDDEYLRERKVDVMQVAERVMKALQGTPGYVPPAISESESVVLVAHDLSPADVIQFKRHQFASFVTDLGGVTSQFFYGGSWRSGRRSDYLFVGEARASRGFVAAVADYRLYPEVRFPDFVVDSALAVRWVSENVASSGGDPEQLFLMGHSAGAYNAAMLAFDEQYLGRVGVRPRAVRGFIGLAGPYDFLPLTSRLLRNVFGYPDTSPATQPINAVRAGAPPVLLLTARTDTIVNPGNSVRLAARLRTVGGRVHEIGYDALDHLTLVGALAVPLRDRAPVLDDLTAFVRDEVG